MFGAFSRAGCLSFFFFRTSGFLVNPAEAAKGTDAFKRANEKEKNEPRQFCSS